MSLSYKQKQEIANKYLKDKGITFGNAMADERAQEMFIDALSYREEMYEHTIAEFRNAWLDVLKLTWDTQFEYLKNQNK